MNVLVVRSWTGFDADHRDRPAEDLVRHLAQTGHRSAFVRIPARCDTPDAVADSMLAVSLSVLELADLVIGIDFPAYLVPHERKVLWLGNLFRLPPGQDEDTRRLGEIVRSADDRCFSECRSISVHSAEIGRRLLETRGIAAPVFVPPASPDDSDAWEHLVELLTS